MVTGQRLRDWATVEKAVQSKFKEADVTRANDLQTALVSIWKSADFQSNATLQEYKEALPVMSTQTEASIDELVSSLKRYSYKELAKDNTLKNIADLLEKASQEVYRTLDIDQYEKKLVTARSKLARLQAENDKKRGRGRAKSKVTQDYKRNYNYIQEFIQEIRNVALAPSKEYGTVLERVVAVMLPQVTNKNISIVANSIEHTGSTPVQRYEEGGSVDFSNWSYQDDYIEVSLQNAFQDRQAKADVVYKMDDIDVGLSIKSWGNIDDNHDFGETYLSYALARLSGIGRAEVTITNYIYDSVHYFGKEQDNVWANADATASLALVYDIVIGLSQAKHKASYIVIHNRADMDQPIRVYAVISILRTVKEKLDKKIWVPSYADLVGSMTSKDNWKDVIQSKKLTVIPSYLGITS